MNALQLGLIGENIAASRAPQLHRCCGRLVGLDIRYELLVPHELGLSFDTVFDHIAEKGWHGVNITLPYKEKAAARVKPGDPAIARIAAINTVRLGSQGAEGFNTDYTGFMAAYRAAFGSMAPGRVMLIGAGGLGKAVAFALVELKAAHIIVVDNNGATARALARTITQSSNRRTSARSGDIGAISQVNGVVNCTPLGMHGYPGSPVPHGLFPKDVWAFDAIYTPLETPFRAQAEASGALFLSGYELFLHQGVQAFEIFTGHKINDLDSLRSMLASCPV